jgi:hypothetical protein
MQVQSSAKVHYSKYAKLGLALRLRSEPRQRFPMNDAKLGWNWDTAGANLNLNVLFTDYSL